MAALMDIQKLGGLLGEAAKAGCRLAWVEDGWLLAGAQIGQARFSVDFVREKLVAVMTEPSDGTASAPHQGEQAPQGGGELARLGVESVDPPRIAGGRRTGNFSLILEGKLHPARSQRELLRNGLEAIERVRPGTLEKLSREKGRTKRPVARQRDALYENVKLSKHAEQIEGGWWVATNNSYPEVEKFIRRAAFHAGLHVELRRAP